MCECDLGYTCDEHHDCAICGRPKPTPEVGLCDLCERTAKAWAKSERHAREFPDPERPR